MGKLTVIEPQPVGFAMPADAPIDAWAEAGRTLIANRRRADWMLADWWRHGQQHYRDEPQFRAIAEHDGADPKRLTAMAKVAEAFPAHMRASNVSFEVHREIAALEPCERLEMIARASNERWNERIAHAQVVEHRFAQGSLLPDDDPEHREVTELLRAWNRISTPAGREYAWAYLRDAAAKNFAPVNMDAINA